MTTYNLEHRINACLTSMLPQLSEHDELIVVEDCSDDRTLDFLKSIRTKYPKVRLDLISNQSNMGPSYSRNRGLKRANQKWIMFVDGDDTVSLNLFAELRRAIELNPECDYVVSGLETHWVDNKRISTKKRVRNIKTGQVLKTVQVLEKYMPEYHKTPYDRWDFTHCWGRLYRRDILLENGLRFHEATNQAEDILFNLDYLMFARYIYFLNQGSYQQFVDRAQGLSSQLGSAPDYFQRMSRVAFRIFRRSLKYCRDMDFREKKLTRRQFIGELLSLGIYRSYYRSGTPLDKHKSGYLRVEPYNKYLKYVAYQKNNSKLFFFLIRFDLFHYYLKMWDIFKTIKILKNKS